MAGIAQCGSLKSLVKEWSGIRTQLCWWLLILALCSQQRCCEDDSVQTQDTFYLVARKELKPHYMQVRLLLGAALVSVWQHRIILVGRDLWNHQVQLLTQHWQVTTKLCPPVPHLPTPWGQLHRFPRQPVPGLDNPLSEESFPNVQLSTTWGHFLLPYHLWHGRREQPLLHFNLLSANCKEQSDLLSAFFSQG